MKKLLVLMLLTVVVSLGGCSVENSSHPSVPVGKEGILTRDVGTASPVAVTEEAMDQFLKAWRANDKYGVGSMFVSGLVFSVDHGTKVLVIDSKTFKRKIRILEGEHKYRAGWVAYEWVRPIGQGT